MRTAMDGDSRGEEREDSGEREDECPKRNDAFEGEGE